MMCFNPKVCWGQNLSFFGLGHGVAKLSNNFISQILMTPFEWSLSKLSKNQRYWTNETEVMAVQG